jgi:hypothetical protein
MKYFCTSCITRKELQKGKLLEEKDRLRKSRASSCRGRGKEWNRGDSWNCGD